MTTTSRRAQPSRGKRASAKARPDAAPRVPGRLRIGHLTYTVTADKDRCEQSDSEGLSDGVTAQIFLRSDRPQQCTRETLLHEVLHQCLYVSGISTSMKTDLEERVVRAAAGPLTAALRDNPTLVAYLLAE